MSGRRPAIFLSSERSCSMALSMILSTDKAVASDEPSAGVCAPSRLALANATHRENMNRQYLDSFAFLNSKCQLKHYMHDRRRIGRLSRSLSRLESDLLGSSNGVFVQPMAQSANYIENARGAG